MKNYINWLLIPVGVILVALFAFNLKAPRNSAGVPNTPRFFYNPNVEGCSQQLLNNPAYRRAYEQSESQWYGPYIRPHNKPVVWDIVVVSLLIIFGVLDFGVSLIARAAHIYFEWRDGEEINWTMQILLAFAVPAAYIIAMIEVVFLFSPGHT